MPAIITHYQFGREAYERHVDLVGSTRDIAEAYVLGHQGPDPFFFSFADPTMPAAHTIGSTMHSMKPNEFLVGLHEAVAALPAHERQVGRAYAMGVLGHYILDSTLHPFIYSQQFALCDAGVVGLTRDCDSEVHAVIESELDELVLWTKQNVTIQQFNVPVRVFQASSNAIGIASRMHSAIASSVYGVALSPTAFSRSVHGFRRVQQLFYSPTGMKRSILGFIEEMARPFSFCRAASPRSVALEESQFDNHTNMPWKNPFEDEVRNESFWELYERAAERLAKAYEGFCCETFTIDDARAITGNLNMNGAPAE